MDLREIGWGSVAWIQLAQDRVAGSCEYGDEPSGSGAAELVIYSTIHYANVGLFAEEVSYHKKDNIVKFSISLSQKI
jgi:hypothetical protein